MQNKQKSVIFASGRGSNAVNIMRNLKKIKNMPEVICLICDYGDAAVIEKMKEFSLPVHVVPFDRDGFETYTESKKDHEGKILAILKAEKIDWLILAGYMRIFSSEFLIDFYDSVLNVNRVLNVHPSLLPDFPGRDGYGDAYAAKVKKHGATIHFVDGGIDSGPIILQRSYDVLENEQFESFKSRGLELEHGLYIDALKKLFKEEPLHASG